MMAGEWSAERLVPNHARGVEPERLVWRDAVAFREERLRRRRRSRAAVFIGALFACGLLQVWLSTQVAEHGSRVSQLQREASRLEEELALARSQLAGRQIYGQLIDPAQRSGFAPGARFRVLRVPEEASPAQVSLWNQMTAELRRGTRIVLPEALAQDLWPEGRGRVRKP